jgi:DNA invertase Pin-like site-specific DNA recombinase
MFDAHLILRFSSIDKEDASIERQKEQCLAVAQKLGCNLKNIKIIANDNLSGALPWDKRFDLLELETDIKQNLCQQVIVYRFDRLARDFEVSGKLLNLLKKHNIRLCDEGGNLDYLTASGEAFFGMKSVFASLERRMIRDRMYSGKIYHFKQGHNWGGPLPLGLKREGKKILEDIPGMEIVNTMFNLVDKGWSIKKIEQWTTTNNICLKKPRKGGGICDWSVKGILTNQIYVTGEYIINTRTEGKLRQQIDITHKVSSELFDKVQRILSSRTPGRPHKGMYLLSGLVYPLLPLGEDIVTNDDTGELVSEGESWGIDPKIRFRAMSKNLVPCYYCSEWGKLRRDNGYFLKSNGKRHKKLFTLIPKDILENKVWDALAKMAENPKTLLKSISKHTMVMETDEEILSNLVKSNEQRIRQLEIALDRFYDVYGQSGDQDDLKKIQNTKNQLNKARQTLIEIQERQKTVKMTLDSTSQLLNMNTFSIINDLRVNGTPEAKIAFIKRYVQQVTIDPEGNISILGQFEVPPETTGVFGRWIQGKGLSGRVLLDNLTSHKYDNDVSSHAVP